MKLSALATTIFSGMLLLRTPAGAQQPELEAAFAFGSRNLQCSAASEPGVDYTMVFHGTANELEYDAARGWGYEVVNPGGADFARFGPFDNSPNNRNAFGDSCPEELYDSFIGGKNFAAPCANTNPAEIPCSPLEGIVFRVDVPNGDYRFVAASGSADNLHTSRIVVENGGSGPPANLGADHVVLVANHDQAVHGTGVFARVGFDGLIPPPAAAVGFVDMDANGEETGGAPSSPTLTVTEGYVRLHQLKGSTTGTDPNGGNMVILELWKVSNSFNAIEPGSTWNYRSGATEASNPVGDWRAENFDDSGWSQGATPIGYGEAEIATTISDMRENYTTLFLRQKFDVTDASALNKLIANIDYDDGFILWINEIEILRVNVGGAPDDPVSNSGLSSAGHESGTAESFDLPNPLDFLVNGSNIIAVQMFNQSITSSDLLIDLEIFNPVAPDLSPPRVDFVVPSAGTTVRGLTQVQVMFDEEVSGVDAWDLLVDGSPATSLTGSDAGPYIFSFPEPAPGAIQIEWTGDNAIVDLSDLSNPFAGGAWSYTLDPDAPIGNLVINEILAVNGTGLRDEDGDEPDWIELLNLGTTSVSLLGWSLSDDEDEDGQWTFPSRSIPPGGYLVVFASGKDRKPTSGNLHTSFKLGADGEFVGLYNAESPRQLISSLAPRYPKQHSDNSWGREGSGDYVYYQSPTPGAVNSGSVTFDGFVVDPIATPGRGFYTSSTQVTLSSGTPGALIRYTLDGSEPTPTRGTLYSSPISVAGSASRGVVTVRALAFLSGLLPSGVITFSYIFPERVMTQPRNPSGFPSTWNGQTADYEMDSRVVNDAGHNQLIRDGLVSLPTLSIVTDVDNLFSSSTGIYANPSREGLSWERAVSAEFMHPDGSPGKQLNCGLRMQGGSSTGGWKVIKVSMRLLFKGDYGPTKLRYKLFPDSDVDVYNTIVLDAHMNQTWQHPSHGQRVRAQYCRDQYVSDLQNATGGYAPHDVFYHLYLNGLYWGVFDLHDRADANFAASYFGGDASEYDAIRHSSGNVVDGSSSAYNTMLGAARNSLSSNANYENLQNYLNVPSLIDYMIVNLYCGNDDWAHHNWYASRHRSPGAGYLFHSWDAEHSLKSVSIDRTSINNSGAPTEVYTRLRSNAEFRLLFADHVHRHFFNEGVLYVNPSAPDWDEDNPRNNRAAEHWMRRIDEIWTAIACEAARWGDTRRSNDPYTRNDEWMTELNGLLDNYFPRRSAIVLNQFRSAGLYPNVAAPTFSRHGGRIDPGFNVTMSAPAGTIYYTTEGSDPRVYGSGAISGSASQYSSAVSLDDHTILKARVRSGTTWSALNEATFSLTDASDVLKITEIMYNPPGGSAYEFIELKNTGDTTIGLSGALFVRGIVSFFGSPVTLGPGEFLVLVADETAFAGRYPGVDIGGNYDGQLNNGGEDLRLLDVEGRIVLNAEYDDEDFWPIGPDGFGYSLVLRSDNSDMAEAESWRASTNVLGSPGSDDPPSGFTGVVINEVLANSSLPLEDAVELYNTTGASINVGGWFLSPNRDTETALKNYRIPNGTTVPGGGYLVLYEADFGFDLNPASGHVFLSAADGGGNLGGYIVEADYGAQDSGVSFGRHATSTGIDFTALTDRSFGSDFPASIAEFRTGGGASNSGPEFGPLVLNEIMYHPSSSDEEFIELYNPTASPVSLYDAAAGRGWRITGVLNAAGSDSFEFSPGAEIPAEGYLLVVGIDPDVFRTLHGVPGDAPVIGAFGGGLSNDGERIRLLRPTADLDDEVQFIEVDRVRFNDAAPWPTSPDGEGPSLERILIDSYGNDHINWGAAVRDGGTPGAANSISDPGGNRNPEAIFTISPQSGEAPLDVVFDASSSYDLGGTIVSHDWNFDDGNSGSGRLVQHRFDLPGIYLVRLTVEDDEGATGSSTSFVQVDADLGGGQIPGDSNQDGQLDISDALKLLQIMFNGDALPCEGGNLQSGGNTVLLDINTDETVDLSDAISLLEYLFKGGAGPGAGTNCLPMPGCDDVCNL